MHQACSMCRDTHICVFTAASTSCYLQGFLRNYARQMPLPETGADDKQADCVARLAPLVAMFAGEATPAPGLGCGGFTGLGCRL
jgi:hypothetical protein